MPIDPGIDVMCQIRTLAFGSPAYPARIAYVEVHRRRTAAAAPAFLERLLAYFPQEVHTIIMIAPSA
jgi:hypothetical protein